MSASQTTAASKDIIVIEPTTAAVSAPLDVDFDGLLTNGTCEVEGTPLTVTRPSSGTQTVSLCIHGNGLDPTMTYAFTGPGAAPGDIPVTASVIVGLFPNTIELDLQISSTTVPGARTLFITSLNNDRASATGILGGEMTKTIRTLAALALVAASFAANNSSALATTLKRMSVADLSRAAHVVVRVRCITNSTRWDAGEIWTFTTFDVEEIWKGFRPRTDHSTSAWRAGRKFHIDRFRRAPIRARRRTDFVSRAHVLSGFLNRQLDAGHFSNGPQSRDRRRNHHARHSRLPGLRSGLATLRNHRHPQNASQRIPLAGDSLRPTPSRAREPAMKRPIALATMGLLVFADIITPNAFSYTTDSTVPLAGGCPQPNRWNLSLASPLNRRWSTTLPLTSTTILTVAAQGTPAQLTEIEQSISDSFEAWASVTGTTFNGGAHPGLIAPLARVTATTPARTIRKITSTASTQSASTNRAPHSPLASWLSLASYTANAPGASVGSSTPAAFAGQRYLDADTLFRNDGQATFATPARSRLPRARAPTTWNPF